MKHSNKKGFTLMEMMLVVAIILFIAGVTVYGVKDYLDKANSWKREVEEHGDMYDRCQSDVDGYLVGFTRETVPSETTDNTPHPGPGPGGNPGGNPGGGGAPDPSTSGETEPGGGGTDTAPSGDVTEPSEPNEGPQNAPGSSYTYSNNPSDYWGGQMKFDNAPRTIIVQVDTDGNSNFDVNANGMYACEPMGNGKYKVTFVADTWASPIKNIPFHIDNGYDFHIVEYT